jgi:hypothetical protein
MIAKSAKTSQGGLMEISKWEIEMLRNNLNAIEGWCNVTKAHLSVLEEKVLDEEDEDLNKFLNERRPEHVLYASSK